MPAKVVRARWRDVAIYARGFWLPTFWALLAALAAIGGAAVSFASGKAPLGVGLLVLALVTSFELGKAAAGIVATAHRR